MFFFENACRMNVFDAKNNLKCNVNSLHNLGENKELKSRLCATMFVLIFVNFEACALSREPPDDRVMDFLYMYTPHRNYAEGFKKMYTE